MAESLEIQVRFEHTLLNCNMQLFMPLPLTPTDPADHWLFDAHTRVLSDGYAEQIMWLYAPDGRPVGTTQQLIAVLG